MKNNSKNTYLIQPVENWERYFVCGNCGKPAIGYVGRNPRQMEIGIETTIVDNVCSDVSCVQAIVRTDQIKAA